MIRHTFEELKATGQLPSPPGVGMRILKLTQDENHSADEISRAIMSDSALTGRLLRIANSAYLGGVQPVTTVPQATMRLGLRAVKNVALGLSLVSQHRSGQCEGFDYDRYWSMSLARAVAAQHLSQHKRVGVPAESYVLGLLCEIGALALATVHPLEYAKVLAESKGKSTSELSRLEREHFEIDHAEVGAYMLEEWGLPATFTQAVQIFESPDKISRCELREVVALAQLLQSAQILAEICFNAGVAPDSEAQALSDSLEQLRLSLKMDTEQFEGLTSRITKDWSEWGELLHVPTRKMSSPREILQRAQAAAAAVAAPVISAGAPPAVAAQADGTGRALRILAVDDESISLRLLAQTLSNAGHNVVTATNGNEALKLALDTNPQVVIADWMMPEMDGLQLCKALRRIESGRNMFFLLLTGRGEEDRIIEAFDAGVDDYVVKPFNSRVLLARIKGGQRVIELQEHVERDRRMIMKQVAELGLMTRKLRNAALTDVLTELPNRRYAMKRLETDWEASTRTGNPLSIIMIDIDHFKLINDSYGHDVGDVVLKETATILRKSTRTGEEASRLGGEEFFVVCPNTREAGAAVCAERLRQAVERNEIVTPTYKGHITISLGVAERTSVMRNFDALIKAADDAVYAAKYAGRNRYQVASTRWSVAPGDISQSA